MNASIRPSGGAVTQFPMMPEKITLGADAKFMTYSIISLGDVKIPRGQGIKEISWSGIFPDIEKLCLIDSAQSYIAYLQI